MNTNNIVRVSLLLLVLTVGVWLLGRPGRLQPEGPARLQALNSLSASGAAESGAAPGDVQVGRTVVHEPVSPAVVDFTDVVIDTDNADSMFDRWLRGELDLDEKESIVSEAEMARMIEEALAQPPDEDVQIVPQSPQAAAPAPGTSFESIDYTQSGGSVPPDPELAVGPNHIIAVVNVALAIYDKTGTALLGPTAAENLYSQSPCTGGLYDPNVLYDEEADRWIIAYDQGPEQTTGGYCVLASQSGDATGTYNEYFFPFNDSSVWLDFPHAGVGDNHIFMGANMFDYSTPSSQFVEGRIFAFDKSDLYSGAAVSAVERGLSSGGSTPQPLNLHGQSSGTWPGYGDSHYILTDPYNGTTYDLRQWDPETDTLTLVGSPNLGGTSQPISAPQNGTGLIQVNDWRPLDFEYRNGYGWTTMTVSCNPGSGAVDCIRWAQIDLTDTSIGPAGTGTYGSNDDYRFFPDLAVNHCDGMAIGYTKSSSTTYPAIWVSGRQATDPNGLLQAEAQLKAGDTAYTAFDGSPFRWGDYTGMTIDPDGETFWYLGQYSKSTGNPNGRWGTYVGSFTYADCSSAAAPPQIGVTPADLQGTQTVDTVVTHTLTISNGGDLDLTWSIDEAAPPAAAPGGSPLRMLPEAIPAPETLARDFSRAPLTDVISDGGFEQGTPNPAWDESSTNFGTPLCTASTCGTGGGTGPRSGSWWTWFGGIDAQETGYVRQDVILPAGAAELSFWLEIPAVSGTGDDEMTVSLDGNELFSVTDADAGSYGTYTQVVLDVSTYADGGTHTLSFDSTVFGGGVTNFFVDDVVLDSLTGCDAPTDVPWASVSPAAGTTISTTTSTVDVVFNAAGLSTDTYTGTLCVNSNDPLTPRVEVPLQMTVETAAVPAWSVYLPYIAKP